MPLQATSGAASYDAFGGGVAAVPNYIENVFSTWLYAGNGSTQTITNGIDLSTKGGLVWAKPRSSATSHCLIDTARGTGKIIYSDATAAQATDANALTAFNTTGYSMGGSGQTNSSGVTYASWTFRKQPKFFDVVTYTGNGALPNQLISHSLGAVPGCIIIKATSAARNWIVWHRGNGTTNYASLSLNLTAASGGSVGSGDLPTATQFKPGAFFDPDYNNGNETGVTYVAYLFAHNAGGFGLTGTDNVISCGSVTTNGSGVGSVNLGWEPQWVLVKVTNTTNDWRIIDNMRGFTATYIANGSLALRPNTSGAESDASYFCNSTGFTFDAGASQTYIYIAIRRGPMKVPTDGTSVYATDTLGGSSGGTAVPAYRAPFPVDFAFEKRTNASDNWIVNDRLRGVNSLNFNLSAAEALYDAEYKMDFMNGWSNYTGSNSQYRSWMMRRAPGFFDEVCYTGNDVAGRTLDHNLKATPELMIVKARSGVGNWAVYTAATTATNVMYLNTTNASFGSSGFWNNTAPTSSVFSIGNNGTVNSTGTTYAAYLFASCPGVSKVFNYTGNGSSQTINCGFTGGARFVMIKRTDSTGDWYVWDSARGIVSGNDPRLSLNTTAAEVTTDDSVDTDSTGFVVNQLSATNINVSSATYIGIAIA